MDNVEKIKLEDIDLTVNKSTALIIEIDVFKFTKQDDNCFVTIQIENQGEYEFLDEIHLYEDTFNIDDLCDLKKFALNWIFKHVELV